MLRVLFALLPALIVYTWFFGWGILIHCILAVLFALILEFLMLKLRHRPCELFLADGSAVVTALLFALCLSPLAPWWVNFSGIAFAIVIAKHVYGGLGYNPFNPAMAGFVFVLLCFPEQMIYWPSLQHPDFPGYIAIIAGKDPATIDALSGATALQQMKSQLGLMNMVSEIRLDPIFGYFAGSGWEWITLMYLFGGTGLLIAGVIRWHTPVAMILGLFLSSLVFNWYDSDVYASPLFHLCAGGSLLCAFFIATDPVTSPGTVRGRLVFGFMIGILCYLIRTWGAYPDGVAFAVLIANACVPLIEILTRPRVVGEPGP